MFDARLGCVKTVSLSFALTVNDKAPVRKRQNMNKLVEMNEWECEWEMKTPNVWKCVASFIKIRSCSELGRAAVNKSFSLCHLMRYHHPFALPYFVKRITHGYLPTLDCGKWMQQSSNIILLPFTIHHCRHSFTKTLHTDCVEVQHFTLLKKSHFRIGFYVATSLSDAHSPVFKIWKCSHTQNACDAHREVIPFRSVDWLCFSQLYLRNCINELKR